jgi:hypothetical protein
MDELEEFEFRKRYEMEQKPSAKPIAWKDVPLEAVKSFGPSTGQMIGDIFKAISSPLETAQSVGNLAVGTFSKALPESISKFLTESSPQRQQQNIQQAETMASDVGQFYKQRYGTEEGIKQALAKDPAGVMADLSTILTGGSMAASKVPQVASVLSKTASMVDPLQLAARGLGKTVDVAGGLTKQALGLTTGVGSEAMGQAYQAGKTGGEAATSFKENLMSRVEPTAVLDAAKQNVAELGRQRQTAYRANMENIKGDKSILNFDGIDKALTDAQAKVAFKGKIKNEAAAQKLGEVEAKVNEWKSLDPAEYHTPEGLDALKQSIGETLESIPFESAQQRMVIGDVYNAVKGEINKQAPTYAKTMKAYSEATDQIKEIERALSLGKKASVDTAMRKLQSLMRNNVQTNYGQRLNLAKQLEETGGQQLMPALAGQALSEMTPRGLQRATSIPTSLGAFSVGGLPAALAYGAVSSPRLMGGAAYGAGSTARGLLDVRNRLPELDYPTMFNLLYQSQQPKE